MGFLAKGSMANERERGWAFLRKGQLNRLAKGSVESTHKVPTSHYRTKHCDLEKGSVDFLLTVKCYLNARRSAVNLPRPRWRCISLSKTDEYLTTQLAYMTRFRVVWVREH